jgi:hypothetical protein
MLDAAEYFIVIEFSFRRFFKEADELFHLDNTVFHDLLPRFCIHDVFGRIENKHREVTLSREDLEPFCEGKTLGVTGKQEVRFRNTLRDGHACLPVCEVGSGISAEVARVTKIFCYGAHLGTFLCRQVCNRMVFGIHRDDVMSNKKFHRRYSC